MGDRGEARGTKYLKRPLGGGLFFYALSGWGVGGWGRRPDRVLLIAEKLKKPN